MSTIDDEVSGISLPFRFSGGRIVTSKGPVKLRSNLAHLLLCGRGERVMSRDYGLGLRQLLHDPNNDALRIVVQHELIKGIARYEPRVRVLTIDISQRDAVMWIRLDYVVLKTKQTGSIALPFGMTSL
jgi:hypothetical protein